MRADKRVDKRVDKLPEEHHITYVRNSDRTRIVFVVPTTSEIAAKAVASVRAPQGFRLTAIRPHWGGPIIVPMDGDNYEG